LVEECLKSADNVVQPLRRLLIRFDLPPGVLDSLKAEFPGVQIDQAPDAFRNPTPLGDADAVVTWALSPAEIDAAPNLRWVQWIGAGVDHAPLDALKARGIVLTNNRGVHANNIAEHLIGMMIAIARNFPRLVHAQDEHHWMLDENNFTVRELSGSRLLILGAGNIGKRIDFSKANLEGVSVGMVVNLAAQESSGGGSSMFKRGSSANASAAMEVAMAPKQLGVMQTHALTQVVSLGGPLPVPGQFANLRQTGGYDTQKDTAVKALQIVGALTMGLGANQSKRIDMALDVDNAALVRQALQGMTAVNQAAVSGIQ